MSRDNNTLSVWCSPEQGEGRDPLPPAQSWSPPSACDQVTTVFVVSASPSLALI